MASACVKNLSTAMVIKISQHWCGDVAVYLSTVLAVWKSDFSDFMDASDAVVQQLNIDGGKVWGIHQKINFRLTRSAAPVVCHLCCLWWKIKNCLKNPELFSMEFRHYVQKKFCVFEIPSIGLKDVLVVPRSELDKEVHSYIWYM